MDNRQPIYRVIQYALLASLGFASVAFPSMVGLFVVILFFVTLSENIFKGFSFSFNKSMLLLVLLYAVYAGGAIFSDHPDYALKLLEYKLSLFVFPLIFMFSRFNKDDGIRAAAIGFVLGVFGTTLYGFYNAFDCMTIGGKACFQTVSISPVHHPTYFVLYYLFAVVMAIYGYGKSWIGFKLYWIIPFAFLGLVMHVLCLSLAGILYLALFIMMVLLYLIYKRYGKWIALGSVVVGLLLSYTVLTKAPYIEGEWHNATWYAEQYMKDPVSFVKGRKDRMSGSEQRLVMWTVSSQVAMENPMGVGTGNVDDYLGAKLTEYGLLDLKEKELNPHNQFLQTSIEVGVLGLILLLLIFGKLIADGIKHRNILMLLLGSAMLFNSLFESMLQRQSGMVFFVFWACILSYYIKSERAK